MKNLIIIVIGAVVFTICAMQAIPSQEPASAVQWWTYGMFGGLAIAAIGIYHLKKDSDD